MFTDVSLCEIPSYPSDLFHFPKTIRLPFLLMELDKKGVNIFIRTTFLSLYLYILYLLLLRGVKVEGLYEAIHINFNYRSILV